MRLLAKVAGVLRRDDIPFALIGAAAMAAHGIARSTLGVDLLTTDAGVLGDAYWDVPHVHTDIRRGDADDPLAGVVRFTTEGVRQVDLIVGRFDWQAAIIRRATPTSLAGTIVPVSDAPGLILLKLFAGGPQDAWDIEQLLAAALERAALSSAVDDGVRMLPAPAQDLWKRLRPVR